MVYKGGHPPSSCRDLIIKFKTGSPGHSDTNIMRELEELTNMTEEQEALEEVICIHASMVHFSNSLSTLSIEGKIQVLEEEGLDEFLLRLDRYIRKYEEIIKESNPGVLGDNQDIPDSE